MSPICVRIISYSIDAIFNEIFKSKPKDVSCPANDTVKFDCSVYKGDILWFVNDIFALGLPPGLNVSFKTKSVGSLINSTLEFIAKESVNNSQIVCAVRGIQHPTVKINAAAKLFGKKLTKD